MVNELAIEQSRVSYVDLPAIIAGAVLALAISLVLAHFGSAVGIAIPAEYHAAGDSAWIGIIGLGLWGLWIQILASLTGGYLAGRMRRPVAGAAQHEREIRDGAHGLLVWATGTVAVAMAFGISAALTAALIPDGIVVADKTPEMIRMEHNATIIFAFMTAASSFVAAVSAWWAGTVGGEHRDDSVDHSRYVSFRKRTV